MEPEEVPMEKETLLQTILHVSTSSILGFHVSVFIRCQYQVYPILAMFNTAPVVKFKGIHWDKIDGKGHGKKCISPYI